MPYNVNQVDLSVVTPESGVNVAERGDVFSEIAIVDFPAGASLELKIGTGGWFRISAPFTAKPSTDADRANGLWWRNLVAQPGSATQIIVVSDGDLSPASP